MHLCVLLYGTQNLILDVDLQLLWMFDLDFRWAPKKIQSLLLGKMSVCTVSGVLEILRYTLLGVGYFTIWAGCLRQYGRLS